MKYTLLSKTEIETRIKEKFGNCYELLSDYNGMFNKITMRHNCEECCNYTWDIVANDLFKSKGCQVCNGKKVTDEVFKKRIHIRFDGKIKCLETYKDSKTKIKFKCLECGDEFENKPNTMMNLTYGCNRCSKKRQGEKTRLPQEEFDERLKEINPCYKRIDTYKGNRTKIHIECLNCGDILFIRPKEILQGSCCKCFSNRRWNTYKVKQKILETTNGEYVVVSEYNEKTGKAKIKHNECGYEYDTNISKFIYQNRRCPMCAKKNESKGEKIIKNYLTENKIKSKKEYMFADLRGLGGGLLKYDFAILNKENEVICLIEFHGEQHYSPIKCYGIKKFYKQRRHDKIKRKYAKLKKIKLIEIPYWEKENIVSILDREFKKLTPR